jgi:protein phosphatase
MVDIDFFELSMPGPMRPENQDAVGHWPHDDGLLFAVADGLGQQKAGQVASTLALEVLGREMTTAPAEWPALKRLRRAVQAANLAIYHLGITVPELEHLGTTLTATAVVGGSLVTAHVGDCRLCLLRDGVLTQLTKDHSWAAEDQHVGRPPDARARRHGLSRCLGQELIVPVDLLSMDLQPGDVLAQCSDGIHASVPEPEMLELLEAHPPEAACRALVRRAREAAAEGDVSIQVARVAQIPSPPTRPWWRLGRARATG